MKDIAEVLKIPPARLYKKLDKPPPKKDPSNVRSNITIKASLNPKSIIVMRLIIFARPSFTPGTGTGTGMALSMI